ncbi:hypothetical protein LJC22_00930 [Desulfosarcina sp. OttesenSCG-928-G10]|nr:hypothetical protein [Desulfosarcina sp. OttesenSCG-928-G10]
MKNASFTVSYYGLKSKIDEFFGIYKQKLSYQAPLAIFISLTATLITSDFKDVYFISKEQIAIAFYAIYMSTLIWLTISVAKFLTKPIKSIDEFCEKIMEESIHNHIEPACLYVIKKYDNESNSFRILCFRHAKTGCFYLPYVNYDIKKSIHKQLDDMHELISHRLGIPPKSIMINYHPAYDMWYQRYSDRKNCMITYDNKIFSAVINQFPGHERVMQNFVSHGRHYAWLTMEEIKDDVTTSINNRQVIQLLEQNHLYLKALYSFENYETNNEES